MGVYGLYIALQQNLNINFTRLPYFLYHIKFVRKLHVFKVFIQHSTSYVLNHYSYISTIYLPGYCGVHYGRELTIYKGGMACCGTMNEV